MELGGIKREYTREKEETDCRHVCSCKNRKTEDKDMPVSWESLHSYIDRNDLCRYEVSPKLLKVIDEGVIISSRVFKSAGSLIHLCLLSL